MQFLGSAHLATTRIIRNPFGLVLILCGGALGPALAFVRTASPVFDDGHGLAPAWFLFLALGAAAIAAWAIDPSLSLRGALPEVQRYLHHLVIVFAVTLALLGLASASIQMVGGTFPLGFLLIAPFKIAAIAALGMSLLGNQNLRSTAAFTALILLGPHLLPEILARVLGLPLVPDFITQALSTVGMLLIGLGTTLSTPARHAIRHSG